MAGSGPLNVKSVGLGMERVCNLRATLIYRLQIELCQKGRSKPEIINHFLAEYNSGTLFPAIYAEIGAISRSTLYVWMRAVKESGYEALMPRYGAIGQSKIPTEDEKKMLGDLLADQSEIKTSFAVDLGKHLLVGKGLQSPSSAAALRRWLNDLRKSGSRIQTGEHPETQIENGIGNK